MKNKRYSRTAVGFPIQKHQKPSDYRYYKLIYLTDARTRTRAHTQQTYKMKKLNVLIACEESQAECTAFRELGHNAYSCDIQQCRPKGHPEWHIHDDVRPYLRGLTSFRTQDGKRHQVPAWDLIIAHPPCTYLCRVSSVQMHKDADTWITTVVGQQFLNWERYKRMKQAREFFMECLSAQADYVAVENPLPMKIAGLPHPDAFACPSWYGVKYTKKTLYWLRNLPPPIAEMQYPNPKCFVRASRGKYRSRTFPQLANALARQWSEYILNDIDKQKQK